MYILKLYRLENDEAVQIMRSYPFAIMITVDKYRPIATHIPIKIREENTLLEHYESNRENGRLWDTFTPGYIQDKIKGIVGFEIEITLIHASGKMSQNRNDRDYKTIVTELEKLSEEDANQVANWMRNRRPHLF